MEITFDTHGNQKQKLAASYWIDDTVSEIGYGGAKGGGKSYLGANLIFGDALLYPGTRFFIARKKLNDLRKHTIPTIEEVFQNWGLSKNYYNFNGTDNYYKLYNDSIVLLIEAKYLPGDPLYQRFGSMQMTRGWIEEAGEFEEEARSNLAASIGRWKNDVYNLHAKLLETCNPSKNYMYKDYYKLNRDNKLPDYRKFIQAFPQDNLKLPAGYIDNLIRTLSKNQKERLLYGNWEYDDNPAVLCDYEAIISSFTNRFNLNTEEKKYITADIALHGSDRFIVIVWQGWTVIDYRVVPKLEADEVTDLIEEMALKHKVQRTNIAYDSDGLGSFLRGYLRNAYPFVNNGKPIEVKGVKEEYKNLKSQCGFMLAEKINKGLVYLMGIKPQHQTEIIEELEQLKKEMKDLTKLKLIDKDEMKVMLKRSPDWMDALLMRSVFDLKTVGGKMAISGTHGYY